MFRLEKFFSFRKMYLVFEQVGVQNNFLMSPISKTPGSATTDVLLIIYKCIVPISKADGLPA